LHHYGKAFGGGAFDPEHAASSTAIALSPIYWKIFYVIGTLSVVFHFSNGLWTFGITWGIWTSDGAQRRAGYVCAAIGILLAAMAMGALYGMSTVDVPRAKVIEGRMQESREMLDGQVAAEPSNAGQQAPQLLKKN
jgi:succinate dehydrogenase / fumarate reductase cytochrome b subunit